MRAVKVLDIIERLEDGDIIKAIAWKVSISGDFPEGIKYAFAYVHKGKRIVGYDNERIKRHHKHFMDLKTGIEMETKTDFQDVFSLFRTFRKEVEDLRKNLYGGEK